MAEAVAAQQTGQLQLCQLPAAFEQFCQDYAPTPPPGHDALGYCARFLNELALQQDGGDLCDCSANDWFDPPGSACVPMGKVTCNVTYPEWLGDGQCDDGEYNTVGCDFDGGDCCQETCDASVYSCSPSTFDCKDPRVVGLPVPCPPPSPCSPSPG